MIAMIVKFIVSSKGNNIVNQHSIRHLETLPDVGDTVAVLSCDEYKHDTGRTFYCGVVVNRHIDYIENYISIYLK